MLEQFIREHRAEVLARCVEQVARRPAPQPTIAELDSGLPLFLDQLVETLHREMATDGSAEHDDSVMGKSAAIHGSNMLRLGFTVVQVVHNYGDVCQAITALAVEHRFQIGADEFRVFNRCLDEAIAEAVAEFSRRRDEGLSTSAVTRALEASRAETERLGSLAHELRNLLNTASLSFDVLQTGRVGVGGSTAAVLGRSLRGLRRLIDRSLAEVRLEAGAIKPERVNVAEILEEVSAGATLEAHERGMKLSVELGAPDVEVIVDRDLVAGAIGNLLNNAFKFSPRGGRVTLRARNTKALAFIEVTDECGGLPPGKAEELFRPFEQRSANRTGLGLGLAISRRSVQANGGDIGVHNLVGVGCLFFISFPLAPPSLKNRP